jgi:hypothetical protein
MQEFSEKDTKLLRLVEDINYSTTPHSVGANRIHIPLQAPILSSEGISQLRSGRSARAQTSKPNFRNGSGIFQTSINKIP